MHDTGCSGLVHWDDPEGWYGDARWEGGSGWGTRVHLWQIHVNVWQNQYNIIKYLAWQSYGLCGRGRGWDDLEE